MALANIKAWMYLIFFQIPKIRNKSIAIMMSISVPPERRSIRLTDKINTKTTVNPILINLFCVKPDCEWGNWGESEANRSEVLSSIVSLFFKSIFITGGLSISYTESQYTAKCRTASCRNYA